MLDTLFISPLVSQVNLGAIPYVVMALYLLLLLVFGVLGLLRSQANEDDYYLAGRQQGWLVSGLTIIATFFSSFALLGAPGRMQIVGSRIPIPSKKPRRV